MHFTRAASLVVSGAVVGIALVLSCGDDSPPKADAADPVCDCPAAEPPITGSRIVQVEATTTVPANDRGGADAGCPQGAIALGGGCAAEVGNAPQIVVEQSIPFDTGWGCDWRNPTNSPIAVRAIVRCLKPGP